MKKQKRLEMSPAALPATTDPGVRERPREPDWKKAFAILATQTCTGFVSSGEVSLRCEALKQAGEPEAADALAKLFNSTRSSFMQGFMG